MRVLVCGAGMAGLSCGITLADHHVTIVERANHLRVNGSPIDIRGDSIQVAAKMGVLDEIRARRVDMSERLQFVDCDGSLLAELPDSEFNDCPDDTEIPREDLADVLRSALDSSTELRFGESITALHDDGDGVEVQFASGPRQRYDLVVGADGMHSATRRLTYGPEGQYLEHLGLYVALADLPGYSQPDRRNPMYNFPGHLAGIATYRDKALGVFMFRAPWIDYDYHDLAAQKRILREAFDGHTEWRIPELLDAAARDPELYFDSISQIHLQSWHRGRVVLVGDSAYCASPLSGRGTSLAMTGAWLLAEGLRDHPDDVAAAFRQYERNQLPHVTYAQGTARPGGEMLVPATQEEIDARNLRLSAAQL
ncbi:FAD-dependent monooxygenase [Mycobacterium vicinigordonae]|uniref:FAD-dependent monooxygenase n=1 Tax=Mycobacterium vicinigordonae TaxID=1719132 RepID=A0A7D6I9X4_9MYCO|nr:FAD-dependent monooxygenase [Mycobacterium vicinigordonae]QLL09436.1 FAD-dependent monooxygenase [Mycobacterium vicinigordonae]